MAGQPKAPFYVVLVAVIIGLMVFAIYRSDLFAPKEPGQGGKGPVAQPGPGEAVKTPGGPITPGELKGAAEAGDTASVTTVKEYAFKPAERLPPVKGTSAYKPLADNTVRFALNVWAGWGPIILANNGFKPGKVWKTPDGKEFKVELVLIDDPVAMRDAYAAGEVHIGWATLGHGAAVRGRLRRRPATAASCRASTSRSTGPTAATASWSARTSRPWPTCAARSWSWPRTRPPSTSP